MRPLCFLLTLWSAMAAAGQWAGNPVAQQLAADYPGTRFESDGHVVRLFGQPMTAGATPEEAAANFLVEYGSLMSGPNSELVPVRVDALGNGRFTVLAYEQYIHGIPVEYGLARILVRRAEPNRVVMASAVVAEAPGAPAEIRVMPEPAIDALLANPAYGHLTDWTEPQLSYFFGEGDWGPAVLTWKFTGYSASDLANLSSFTFFVDVANGAVVHVRDEVYHVDVTGTVMGNATPGTKPDTASNPEVLIPLELLQVSANGSNDLTDAAGAFVIPNGGAGSVTVQAQLAGAYANVFNAAGAEEMFSQSLTPPGNLNIVFNPSLAEFNTAQVNGYAVTTKTHNYFKNYAPSFTALDLAIQVNVNIDAQCNAVFSPAPLSTNFFRAGACRNSAYSTIAAHEYGHFIVNRLGLGQGGFGEGFSDVIAMMMYNISIIGEDFGGTGQHIRVPPLANVQYPCAGGSHHCGQLLGGVWWDIRSGFMGKLGAVNGLEHARQLQVDWALVTAGGLGGGFVNSAHPGTAVEVLTLDDDDGDLNNGTPNYDVICDAFANHSIECTEIIPVFVSYPDGVPGIVIAGRSTSFTVEIIPNVESVVPGTPALRCSVDGGEFASTPLAELGDNAYQATLPAIACGSSVAYYIEFETTGSGLLVDPEGAPAVTHVAHTNIVFRDDFEFGGEWIAGVVDDTATAGVWVRVDPNSTSAAPGDDVTPAPGVRCYTTGQAAANGANPSASDVDGGKVTLVSPKLDLSRFGDADISYWRWYSNHTGTIAPFADVFRVDVSNDDGQTWTNVETVGPTGPEASGGWFQHTFRVSDFVEPTDAIRVRFVASDEGAASNVDAAVDEFEVRSVNCLGSSDCLGDLDGDGTTGLADLGALLSAYGAGPEDPNWLPEADFDGDQSIGLGDLGVVLTGFGTVCE